MRKDAQQDLEFSPAVKVKRQVVIPTLGDMRFALKDGGIVEGKIVPCIMQMIGSRFCITWR